MRVILASKSPRRKEILENIGIDFEIIVSDVDESSAETDPCRLVEDLSLSKAKAVADTLDSMKDTLVIGCDTVVVNDNKILGKPKSKKNAYEMISSFSGSSHKVISGLSLIYQDKFISKSEITTVYFDKLTNEEIEEYVNMSEPYDKAGGYAVQGYFSKYIKRIDGCYQNVVGMPVNLLHNMLKELGIML